MPKRRTGFTLVELLVVIGIIAVLMGILIPVLSRARENANRIACMSNVRQIANAFFMYCNENKGWFPGPAVFGGPGATALGWGTVTTPPPVGYPADWIGWPEDWIVWRGKKPEDRLLGAIVKYLGNPTSGKVMMCPSDDSYYRRVQNVDQTKYPYSYTMNSYMSFGTNQSPYLPLTQGTPKNNLVFPTEAAWKLSQVRRSADKILVYEEDERALRDGRGQLQSPAVGMNVDNIIGMVAIRHDQKRQQPDNVPDPLTKGKIEDQQNRERKGNVGFVDGHADYVSRMFAHSREHYSARF